MAKEKQPKVDFDFDAHERMLAERYARLAMFDAFDRFIDLALDGTISMDEAIKGFTEEYAQELA